MLRAHRAPQRSAVHARHVQVGDDGVEARSLQQLQRHRARLGGGDLVARAFEHRAHHLGDLVLVVHHQQPRLRGGLGGVQRHAAGGVARLAADRQAEAERSAAAVAAVAFEHQVAAVLAQHGARHRQPESGAQPLGLGGEEGLEDARLHRLRHAGPGVGHTQPDALRAVVAPRLHAGLQRDAARPRGISAGQRLLRIDDQVQQHLAHLVAVGHHLGQRLGQLQHDGDAVAAQRVAQHLGGGARQVVQLHRRTLRRALPRHVQERAHDAAAALGGLADALRVALQRRALGLLLEQAGAAHHDGQRVVQLVRHAGQQAAHRGELLALAQRVALALDLAGALDALGDVAHRGGVVHDAVELGAEQHHLHRELAAVVAQRRHLHAPAHHPRRAAGGHARHARGMGGAVLRRHDQRAHLQAQHVGAAAAEHGLGRRVELDDAALAVGADDAGDGVVDDGGLQRLGLAPALLQFALALEGLGDGGDPALPAAAEPRRRGLGVGRQRPQVVQDGQCRTHEAALQRPLAGHDAGQQRQRQQQVGHDGGQHARAQRVFGRGLHVDPGRADAHRRRQQPAGFAVHVVGTEQRGVQVGPVQPGGQPAGQRRQHRRVGQPGLAGRSQRLLRVGQHVAAHVGDPHAHAVGAGLRRRRPLRDACLQIVEPEVQADLAAVAAVDHHHRAVRHHELAVELAHVGWAPEHGVLGVARQRLHRALHGALAWRVDGLQAGCAHRLQDARAVDPRVAERGVGLGGGEPGGLEAGRALVHDARQLDEALRPPQPGAVGRAAVGWRPPDLAEALAQRGGGRVQRPAVVAAAGLPRLQRAAQRRSAVGRVVPVLFHQRAQVLHVRHRRAHHGFELLRALFGTAQQVALGVLHALLVLQHRQHRQQQQHRHQQRPQQAPGGAQRAGAGICARLGRRLHAVTNT